MPSQSKLDPLRDFLDAVVSRIETLEAHCGVGPIPSSSSSSAPMQKVLSVRHISGAGETPSLKAFDKFLHSAVFRLADSCDDLEMENLGRLVTETFEGMRYVLVLASRAKQPADLIQDLQPHLKPMTDAVSSLRGLKLNRDFDNHMKAIMEMIASVSWLTMRAPSQLPAPFVKECIGSSDFWSNRIRKEFKGKEKPAQIAFCDNTKKLLQELAEFITEHHAAGLAFNLKGVSLAEAAVVLTDNPLKDAAAAAVTKTARSQSKRASLTGNTVQGGNVLGLISELAGRQSEEGDSAATGLKHVTKDQQTWRKEFGGAPAKVVVQSAPPAKKAEKKKKKTGLPIFQYQDRGTKWVIENQTKESAKNHSESGILEVEISDPKQQVYIFNCDEVTIKVSGGKLKSLIVDTCEKVNVIFDTIISGCELVNSKKIAVQTDGVCPVFTIDKTVGVTIWLSEASSAVTSFTTSMSSEMNVSIPHGDDRKELVIPEQFVHRITDGSLSSQVSDLYH